MANYYACVSCEVNKLKMVGLEHHEDHNKLLSKVFTDIESSGRSYGVREGTKLLIRLVGPFYDVE